MSVLEKLGQSLVLTGMSCVGKTYLACCLESLGFKVIHFDEHYKYGSGGLPGVSKVLQWERIAKEALSYKKVVIDNWATEDTFGRVLGSVLSDVTLVVLFDEHSSILQRYRVPVRGEDAHRMMYDKIYGIDYRNYEVAVRYLKVNIGGNYEEYDREDFLKVVKVNSFPTAGWEFDKEDWLWKYKNV